MKRTLLATISFFSAAELALSQGSNIPETISYQGRVADANGVLVGDPIPVNRTITLRIYGSPTGTDRLFSEQQVVTISKGQFSVLLGTGLGVAGEANAGLLRDVFNGRERFLGLTVDDGTPTVDPEVSPRQKIVSSAFALRSQRAENSDRAALSDSALVAQSVNQLIGNSNFDWVYANNLTMNGHTKISGSNVLEFGIGLPRANGFGAGYIGYQSNSSGLDVVGAVTTPGGLTDRRITMWAEAGTEFKGPINFGNRLGQHVNLWGTNYGIGIQNSTFYQRTGGHFAWFLNGSHNDSEINAGGGTALAWLNGGGLWVNSGNIYGTLNGNAVNCTTDRGGHGVFSQSYGGGHSFGSQDWTTYSRSARRFSWYLGGSWVSGENDPGGGTRVATMDDGGLRIEGSRVIEFGAGIAKFGDNGKIGYGTFSPNDPSLDITGLGTDWSNRKVRIYCEGGLLLSGAINLDGARKWTGYWLGGDADTLTNGGVGATNNQTANDVVLSAWSGRLVADRFTAISDARLKKIAGVSNAADDLNKLMKLQVTDYVMKDDPSKKPRQNKKVVAQQVEEVFPQAVSTMQGPVPDLLTLVTAKDGLVKLEKPLPAAVKKGDVLKVWAGDPKDGGAAAALATVAGVSKDGFQFADKLDGKVFLYGHQVNDLRSVDYEAIAMLNVSATQEIQRRMEAQAAEIKRLSEEKAALEKALAETRAENTAQDARLVAIEKALKLQAPATVPRSTDKPADKVATRR